MADRKLIVRVVGDERALLRSFKNAEVASTRFSRTIEKNLGQGAGSKALSFQSTASKIRGNPFLAGATGGAAAFGAAEVAQKLRESIGLAGDLNEALSKNDQIFGDSAETIQRWSTTTATSIGVARLEAVAAAGDFGGLFRTIGLGETSAATMSRRLVELAADLASFNNTSIDDAIAALRSGLVGESEPLRRYQVLLSEARVSEEAFASGIAKRGAKLTEAQKVQARFNVILRDSAQAQGDFNRTADQFANQQRILGAQVRDLQTDLGKLAVPYLTDVVSTTNDTIEGLQVLGRELDNLADKVERLTGKDLGGGIGDAAKNVARLTLESNTLTRPLADALDILIEIGKAGPKTFADMTSEANAFREAISLKGLGGQTIFDLTLPDFTSPKAGPTPPFKGAPFDVEGGLDVLLNLTDNIRGVFDGVDANIAAAQERLDAANERAEKQREGFERLMDRLALRVDIAAANGNLQAELAGLQEQERVLREQVRIEGHTVEIDRQLFDLRQERLRLQDAARSGLQFKSLGLNEDGTAKVPGVASLRKQLGSLSDRIAGTPLDTKKTRTELSRIARVLRGDYGKVGDDVASAILRMFEKIRDALKDGGDITGPITKTTSLNASQITRGIEGLDASAAKEIRARLSRFNSAGKALAGPGGANVFQPTNAGFGATIVVKAPDVYLDGVKVSAVTRRHDQIHSRRNPRQKRGPNA
jgi:hypothetical protein